MTTHKTKERNSDCLLKFPLNSFITNEHSNNDHQKVASTVIYSVKKKKSKPMFTHINLTGKQRLQALHCLKKPKFKNF